VRPLFCLFHAVIKMMEGPKRPRLAEAMRSRDLQAQSNQWTSEERGTIPSIASGAAHQFGTRNAWYLSEVPLFGGKMMALVIDIVSAAGQLEAAILDVTTTDPDILVCSKSMKAKAKLLPQVLVEHYPELSFIQRELRGVFEACSDAVDRKSVNPVVVKAAISIAEEYRQVIEGLKRGN
jgi:hypothetical protein